MEYWTSRGFANSRTRQLYGRDGIHELSSDLKMISAYCGRWSNDLPLTDDRTPFSAELSVTWSAEHIMRSTVVLQLLLMHGEALRC